MMIAQRRDACLHEAGHIVMGLLVGIPVSKAEILMKRTGKDSISFGTVAIYEYDKDRASVEEIEGRIMVYLAGQAAECALLNRKRWRVSSDIKSAMSLLRDLYTGNQYFDGLNRESQTEYIIVNFQKRKRVVENCFLNKKIIRMISNVASLLYRNSKLNPVDMRCLRREILYRNTNHLHFSSAMLKGVWENGHLWD